MVRKIYAWCSLSFQPIDNDNLLAKLYEASNIENSSGVKADAQCFLFSLTFSAGAAPCLIWHLSKPMPSTSHRFGWQTQTKVHTITQWSKRHIANTAMNWVEKVCCLFTTATYTCREALIWTQVYMTSKKNYRVRDSKFSSIARFNWLANLKRFLWFINSTYFYNQSEWHRWDEIDVEICKLHRLLREISQWNLSTAQ